MIDRNALREAILKRLATVIDPETGADVVRMRLIEDLVVDENGVAQYKFRPSSPLCPIAVPLALAIRKAVAEVEGVTRQEIEVVGYLQAGELNAMLRELDEAVKREGGLDDVALEF
ncbi:MAG: metal-sulfur cluster assembly factor [Anaerolineae bacterium]